jgi:hypothetical protein
VGSLLASQTRSNAWGEAEGFPQYLRLVSKQQTAKVARNKNADNMPLNSFRNVPPLLT